MPLLGASETMKKAMRTALGVVFVNSLILAAFLECAGHFIISRKKFIREYPVDNQFARQYLDYVNHMEGKQDFSSWKTSDLPSNYNQDSFEAFSIYGDCKGKSDNALLQGDSWMGMLNIHSRQDIIPVYMSEHKGCIINAGTGSFSPSNLEGQVAFFAKIGYDFDTVIAYLDQTDVGDEFYRYKEKIKVVDGTLRVRPFGLFEHTSYYNYKNDYFDHYTLGSGLKEIFFRLARAVPSFKASRYSEIAKPLKSSIKDCKECDYFALRVRTYIEAVSRLTNAKSLTIITHPHYQHYTGEYQDTLNPSIAKAIMLAKTRRNLAITHIDADPLSEGACKSNLCQDYFQEGDISSHPKPEKLGHLASIIANQIRISVGSTPSAMAREQTRLDEE